MSFIFACYIPRRNTRQSASRAVFQGRFTHKPRFSSRSSSSSSPSLSNSPDFAIHISILIFPIARRDHTYILLCLSLYSWFFYRPFFYSMAAQNRTGSPRYPTFPMTTKPQMGCTRYTEGLNRLLPHDFYIINVSECWDMLTLLLRGGNVQKARTFFPFSLSLYLSLCLSLSLLLSSFFILLFSLFPIVRHFLYADFCNSVVSSW